MVFVLVALALSELFGFIWVWSSMGYFNGSVAGYGTTDGFFAIAMAAVYIAFPFAVLFLNEGRRKRLVCEIVTILAAAALFARHYVLGTSGEAPNEIRFIIQLAPLVVCGVAGIASSGDARGKGKGKGDDARGSDGMVLDNQQSAAPTISHGGVEVENLGAQIVLNNLRIGDGTVALESQSAVKGRSPSAVKNGEHAPKKSGAADAMKPTSEDPTSGRHEGLVYSASAHGYVHPESSTVTVRTSKSRPTTIKKQGDAKRRKQSHKARGVGRFDPARTGGVRTVPYRSAPTGVRASQATKTGAKPSERRSDGTDSGVLSPDELVAKFPHPQDFERWCASLFRDLGCRSIRVTNEANDGGYDLLFQKGNQKWIAECKRYKFSNHVGRPEVQKLVGANALVRADRMAFITTSSFTAEASEYCKRVGVRMIDGSELVRLQKKARKLR